MTESVPSKTADQVALALDRTRLAYDRTLMAGLRTALSLIAFGFTVYKFFELEAPRRAEGALGSRGFALLLVAGGLITLLASELQYLAGVRELRRLGADVRSATPAIVAGVVAALGLAALAAVVWRH